MNAKVLSEMDKIRYELKEVGSQMGGLNPKTSSWQKLNKRKIDLDNRLDALKKAL